jgi:hypothetical protein
MIEAIGLVIGMFFVIGLVVAYSAMSWGFVLYKFWYWFLLPVFPNLPHITFLLAIGLMMFVDLFKTHAATAIKDEFRDKNTEIISNIIAPWIVFVVGYFVHWGIS